MNWRRLMQNNEELEWLKENAQYIKNQDRSLKWFPSSACCKNQLKSTLMSREEAMLTLKKLQSVDNQDNQHAYFVRKSKINPQRFRVIVDLNKLWMKSEML